MEVGIRRTLLIATIASSVAFAVDAVASPSWEFGQLTLIFWALLGAGTSCLRPHTKSREEHVAEALPLKVTRPITVFASLLVAFVIPTVAFAAGGGGYRGYPVSAALTPKSATATVGNKQQYTLQVKFSSNATIDVSEENSIPS